MSGSVGALRRASALVASASFRPMFRSATTAFVVLVAALAAFSPAASASSDPEAERAGGLSSPSDAAPSSLPGLGPDDGQQTAETRPGPEFLGMGALFPLRLHFARGGHLDGRLGGVDAESGQLLLKLPERELRIALALVAGVTPLGPLPPAGSVAAAQAPPPLLAVPQVARLLPTWRSGVGLVLNVLAPGMGSFMQKQEKEFGFVLLGLDAFFLAAGTLAVFAPSRLTDRQRAFFGLIFFSFDGLTRVLGASQAFAEGRERVFVEVGPGGRVRTVPRHRSLGGGLTPTAADQ